MAQVGLDQKWTQKLTTTGIQISAGMLIPGWLNELGLALDPSGNTAQVEVSLEDDSVADGTAVWFAWDAGLVTVKTIRATVGPVCRVRLNQTVGAGVSTLFLAGQRRLP